MRNIAFIGFGEVGFSISMGLRADFPEQFLIESYDVFVGSGKPYENTLRERAKAADVVLFDSMQGALRDADLIFSAVQGSHAYDAGRQAVLTMKESALYVDLTTANPQQKFELEEIFISKERHFVDAAMLGPLPLYKNRVPTLLSGHDARSAQEKLKQLNMNLTLVPGPAGEATKIKLIRSVFMKGLQALLTETFLFAHKAGVEGIVLNSLSETMDRSKFEETVKRLITADPIHSQRRAHEVSESVAVMKSMGVRPIVATAIEKRLEASAALGLSDELAGKVPETVPEVLALWEQKNYS